MTELARAADSNQVLTIDQQNDVSAKVIVGRFFDDVAASLKIDAVAVNAGGDGPSSVMFADTSSYAARRELQSLQNDPLKNQVLNDIASEMGDGSTLQKLGISGTVIRDKSGSISSFEFTYAEGQAAYRNAIYSRERDGQTPTQAAIDFDNIYEHIPEFHGETTINANGK